MKLRLLFTVLSSLLLLSCDNDDYPFAEVPSVVLNEFMTEYPDATDVEFYRAGDNYEIEYEIAGKENAALINSSGNILKEKKEISWYALPSEVRETLDKKFGTKDIRDPELVKWGNKIYYQAEVEKFFIDKKIVLDKDGKLDAGLSYWK